MTFTNRLDALLENRKMTRAKLLETLGLGKNQFTYWEKNNTIPNTSTLNAIAAFFGVSVDYLKGIEDDEAYALRVTGLVVDWLVDNEYEYAEDDNNTVSIGKNGDYIHLALNDFIDECMAIKRSSENAFDLAMREWERQNFFVMNVSGNKIINQSENVINDSPNATLTINNTNLSKQEQEIVELYRAFTLEQQLSFLSYALKVKNGEI